MSPPPRAPTRPEGFPVIPPEYTPTPVMAEHQQMQGGSGWRPSITIASVVIGIVLGVGAIIGGLGKAFYVERTEYTQKVLRDAEDRINNQRALEQLSAAVARQEAAISRLTDAVQAAQKSQKR